MQRGTEDFETIKTHIFSTISRMGSKSEGGATLSGIRLAVKQARETFQFSDTEIIYVVNCLIEDGLIKVIKLRNQSMPISSTRFDFSVEPIIART